jgi:HAD superfamily hydrolase (TIGR01509 family)
MLKALLFDIDGTLLDSVDLHAQAWAETMAHFGHPIPVEELRAQIGKGGDQLMPVFLDKDELEKRGEEIQKFRSDLFKKKFRDQVRPFPDVRELFVRLRSDGYKLALASSSKGDELQYYKRLAHVDDLLEAETSSEDAERSKPHPDIFEAAVKQLGSEVKPEDTMVIGDTPYDMEAARKIGIKGIGVLCGGFSEQSLRDAGAIAIFEGPSDLLNRYEETPFSKSGNDSN